MAKEQGRPGVMIYFEVRESLKFLSLEEKGKLFDAVLEYGELGVIPEFDGMLGMAWAFMKPKLDADAERYEDTVQKRKYANVVKKLKKSDSDADIPSFEQWQEINETTWNHMESYRTTWTPTTTTITTASPTTTPTTTATTEIKKKEEKELSMQERKEQMIRQLKAYQE